jgi:hypothetical protein
VLGHVGRRIAFGVRVLFRGGWDGCQIRACGEIAPSVPPEGDDRAAAVGQLEATRRSPPPLLNEAWRA